MPTPMTVAFAGSGYSSYANTSDLLDDWLPEEVAVFVQSPISEDNSSLKELTKWLGYVEQPYDEVSDSVKELESARNNGDDVTLVLLWGDGGDDTCRNLLAEATEREITVLDLTHALLRLTIDDKPESFPNKIEDDTPNPPKDVVPASADEAQSVLPEGVLSKGWGMSMEEMIRAIVREEVEMVVLHKFNHLFRDTSDVVIDSSKASALDEFLPQKSEEMIKVVLKPDGSYGKRKRGKLRTGDKEVDITMSKFRELGLDEE